MVIHLVPELRRLKLPDSLDARDILSDGMALWNIRGHIWALPEYPHPYIRVGDMLAAFQNHPSLEHSGTHCIPDGYVTTLEDDGFIFQLRVLKK